MRTLLFSVLFFALMTTSISGQGITLRFGEVSGQPGEVVAVPVYCTYDKPLLSAWLTFTFDTEAITPLAYTVEGTAAHVVDPLSLFLKVDSDACICGIGRREYNHFLGAKVPPGNDVHIGNVMVQIQSDAALAPSAVVPQDFVSTVLFKFGTVIDLMDPGSADARPIPSYPEAYLPGSVSITPPVGPRPVGDLQCTQFLDRIQLRYALTETYDTLDVLKDGEVIASIPGTQDSYTDGMADIGDTVYSLVAHQGGAASIPVACEVDVAPPVAPSVTDLRFVDGGLRWEVPLTFDQINVLRDGEQIASLPGDSTSYQDPELDDEVVVYSIITELEGFQSPKVSCTANGLWVFEVGDVQAPVDASVVKVPVYGSILEPVHGFSVTIDLVDPRFQLLPDATLALLDTVLYQEPDFLSVNNIYPPFMDHPTIGIVFTTMPGAPDAYQARMLKPGLRQKIVNFHFECIGPFSPGEVIKVGISEVVMTIGDITGSYAHYGDMFIPGEIHFGESGTQAVQHLQAEFSPEPAAKSGDSTVSLSWQNAGGYDALRITRNGELIAELPGTATQYRDTGVPSGFHVYKVIAVDDAAASFPASIFLNTVSVPNAFLRGDGNRDGRIDLADAIFTLYYLFNDGTAKCEDAMDVNDDGKLDLSDAVSTLSYLFQDVAPIPSPGVDYPWFDPTEDALTCHE